MKIQITHAHCAGHKVGDIVEVADTKDGNVPAWATNKAIVVSDDTPTSEGSDAAAEGTAPAAEQADQNPDPTASDTPKQPAAPAPAPKQPAAPAPAPKAEAKKDA